MAMIKYYCLAIYKCILIFATAMEWKLGCKVVRLFSKSKAQASELIYKATV